jgi:hypothetical protein
VKIIDLSVPIMNYSMDTHEQSIIYLDHREVARQRDEIPLEWCYGSGVRLDFRAK